MNDEINSLTDPELVQHCIDLGIPTIAVAATTRDFIRKKIRNELEKRNQSLPLAASPKSSSTPKQQHRSMAVPTTSTAKTNTSSVGSRKKTTTVKNVAHSNGDQFSYDESNGNDMTDSSASAAASVPEPMDVDPYPNGNETDDRPVEPPTKKRPVFSSTMRNSPLLKPVVAAADQNNVAMQQGELKQERYLSEFGRRLTKMPATSSTQQLFLGRGQYQNLIRDTADSRTQHAHALNSTLKSSPTRNTKVYDIKMNSSATKKTSGFWPWSSAASTSSLVSFSLLMLVVAFFAFIIAKYFDIVKSSSTSAIDDIYMQELTSLTCSTSSEDGQPVKNARCILPGDFKATVAAFKKLQEELKHRAVSYMCGLVREVGPLAAASERPFMTFAETKRFLGFQLDGNLMNLILYAWGNNDFKIDLIEISETSDETFKQIENIDGLIDRFETIPKSLYGFIDSNPKLTLSCRMLYYFRTHTNQLLRIGAGLLAASLISLVVMFYRNRERSRKNQIRLLTQKTIELLQKKDAAKKDGTSQESYLPLNHIRDMLIPSEKRIAMEQIWQTVIRNLKETESRIRVESRVVAGEEFEVWSWIGSGLHKVVHNLSRGNNASLWQGQAFETQAGAMNNPQTSPTSCLKVRGMMQKDAVNNHEEIRQNVRKKCESNSCKIIHCAVESDCVYLKCASPGDAAHAYQELHGWWYDGNLITVKYLRDERYNERFPDAANQKI